MTKINTQISRKNTTDFLNSEVKDFALSVIKNRSLPNIMDGMRSGARKIIYASQMKVFNKKDDNKPKKMVKLIGEAMNMEFHHGDVSLKNTIESLSAKHLFKYCPFEVVGQMGTLRNPDVSTAARYLSVRKRDYLDWFKMDKELFEYNFDDGTKVEPTMFLPLVPIVLLWRTNSPGFGYSFRSFSYNLDNIIDAILSTLISGSCSGLNEVRLKPEIEGINPDNIIYNENRQCWYNVGEYVINEEKDTLTITDLPFNIYSEKYTEHLNNLKSKMFIKDFDDLSSGGKINIVVEFYPKRLKNIMLSGKLKFFTQMKLYSKLPKLTLNTIDVDNNSILHFDNENDLIEGFVKRRLKFYELRKVTLIKSIKEKLSELEDLIKFVQLVVDNKIEVRNRKKQEIKADCDKFGVSYKGLELKISKLTNDEIIEMEDEIEQLIELKKYTENTSIGQMYINDLIEFKIIYAEQIIDKTNGKQQVQVI